MFPKLPGIKRYLKGLALGAPEVDWTFRAMEHLCSLNDPQVTRQGPPQAPF